jgi:hypothetical protein
LLIGGIYVAVPSMDGYFGVSAEVFKPSELIVDEGLQRANIERLNGRFRLRREDR